MENHREGDCVFCDLPAERIVAENDLAVAFLDAYPVTSGHTLVIPRRHVADLFGLSQDEVLECDALIRTVSEQLRTSDATVEGFNIGLNIGEVAGQTVFHCHFHVIPRRAGDVAQPRGGVRHVFPGKGAY